MNRLVELILGKPPSRDDRYADRFRWDFEWPAEVLARGRLCSTADFAAWLQGDGENAAYSRRQLISRYAEFIELTGTRPITGWHRFDLSLKPAGILRVRLSSGSRPWLYRVEEPHVRARFSR